MLDPRIFLLALMGVSLCVHSVAAEPEPWRAEQSIDNFGEGALTEIPEDCKPFLFASKKDLQWFEDAKFGVFICWGPCSLVPTEIGWGRYGPRPGNKRVATGGVPQAEYDNLYKKFNPVKFDADEWVKVFRDAGAKYMIFLTKHHDGFVMFDSKETDYDIMSTPYGKDICKQLADACHKYGIKIFWYYSQPDWHHRYYLTKHHERYRKYVYSQIRELLTNYGKIDGIWFDCLNTKWRHWNTPELVKMIRTLQPGILINSRWGWGMPGVAHNGDFDNPEQKLGMFRIDRPWESCMTMGGGWSWRGGGDVISADKCLELLVRCVGDGGKLALDTGPRPAGTLDPDAVANYLAIGRWLKKNGDAIYATRGGPYKPGLYGVSTRKGDKVFIHILAKMGGGNTNLSFPDLKGKKVLGAATMDGRKVELKRDGANIVLDLAGIKMAPVDTIIVLTLDGSAVDLNPVDVDRMVPLKRALASSCFGDGKRFGADALVHGGEGEFDAGIHRKRYWLSKGGGKPQWVEVELKEESLVKGVFLEEPRRRCVAKDFKIQYDDNGEWKTVYEGHDGIGRTFSLIFPAVKTKKMRLCIDSYGDGCPGLKTFSVYRAGN